MTASELAKKVGRTRGQIARIAETIPGHRLTRGGQHYFTDCPKLRQWISEQIERRVRGGKRAGLGSRAWMIAREVTAERRQKEERARAWARMWDWKQIELENSAEKECRREEAKLSARLGVLGTNVRF